MIFKTHRTCASCLLASFTFYRGHEGYNLDNIGQNISTLFETPLYGLFFLLFYVSLKENVRNYSCKTAALQNCYQLTLILRCVARNDKRYLSIAIFNWIVHCEIIIQLGYNSGHIANPFPPSFIPIARKYHAPLNQMWPRINYQNILDPLW